MIPKSFTKSQELCIFFKNSAQKSMKKPKNFEFFGQNIIFVAQSGECNFKLK